MSESGKPSVAVVDDGELLLVREMLIELGVDLIEDAGVGAPPARRAVALLITNPKHALSSSRPPAQLHLVVYENVSKMLRKALDRSGCDLALQSPLNSAVLKMLVERAGYQGPERRTRQRAVVAADVKLRVGLRTLDATLGQLSARGCSLVLSSELTVGRKLKLTLPAELGAGGPLKLEATVLSCNELPNDYGGYEAAARFEGVTPESQRALAQIVGRNALPDRTAMSTRPASPSAAAEAPAAQGARAAASSSTADGNKAPKAHVKKADAKQADGEKVGADRRKNPRKLFRSQLLATGGGGSRLLFGCDLSTGGMRIRRDAEIEVGDRLKLALHVRKGLPSVMLQAVVAHEGEDGSFGLAFVDVPEKLTPKLQEIVDSLPPLTSSSKSKPGVLVSEVLEHLGSESKD